MHYLEVVEGIQKIAQFFFAVQGDPPIVDEGDHLLEVGEVHNWHKSHSIFLVFTLEDFLEFGRKTRQDDLVDWNQGHSIFGEAGVAEKVAAEVLSKMNIVSHLNRSHLGANIKL